MLCIKTCVAFTTNGYPLLYTRSTCRLTALLQTLQLRLNGIKFCCQVIMACIQSSGAEYIQCQISHLEGLITGCGCESWGLNTEHEHLLTLLGALIKHERQKLPP